MLTKMNFIPKLFPTFSHFKKVSKPSENGKSVGKSVGKASDDITKTEFSLKNTTYRKNPLKKKDTTKASEKKENEKQSSTILGFPQHYTLCSDEGNEILLNKLPPQNSHIAK